MSLEIAWERTDPVAPADRETISFVDLKLASREPDATWRRCTLTSDFLAGFLSSANFEDSGEREELSVVIDELLANAVKFSADVEEPVSMTVQRFENAVRVEASNLCNPQQAQRLVGALRRAIEENLEDLFVHEVETNAEDAEVSRLGFITLRINFGARLGARITHEAETGLYRVHVALLLDRSKARP